jgi:hypothetical protein
MKTRTRVIHVLAVTALVGAVSATTATTSFAAQAPKSAVTQTVQAESGSWPVYDAAGVERISLSYNSSTGYAMACYPPSGVQVVIEARFASGETAKRAIPERGCNVIGPIGNSGSITAVRGWVDDFANEWHEVA